MAWRPLVFVWVVLALLFGTAYMVNAQSHHHPPQDAELHHRFYSTWMKPDNPKQSCCNLIDCYPTEARHDGTQWWGKRREDGKWLRVPSEKVEQNRDMPDARAHMCAPPPTHGDVVYCFGAGSGT